ncbi:MAG: hypothetical protein ABMA64_05540 [Myxococcota bacterium]
MAAVEQQRIASVDLARGGEVASVSEQVTTLSVETASGATAMGDASESVVERLRGGPAPW